MPIANVTLNNTFDEWRTVTNQIITFVNEVDAGNLTKFYSNSAVLTVTENVARNGKNFITLNTSSNYLDSSTLNLATSNAVYGVVLNLNNTDARLVLVSNDANGINSMALAARIHSNLAFAHANAAFNNANTVMVSAQAAFTVANSGFLHANAAFYRANTANITADRAWNHANAAFSNANTILVTAQSAFTMANSGFAQANTARDRANAAYDLASAVGGSTAPIIEANKAGFDQANLAFAHANAGFRAANTANITADRAWNHANAGFDRANTSLPNVSGTSFSGNLFFPTGNVAIGRATTNKRFEVNGYLSVNSTANANVEITDGTTSLAMGIFPTEAYIGTLTSDALFIRTSGVDRARFGSAGGMTSYGSYEIQASAVNADFYLNSVGGSGKIWLMSSDTGGNYSLYDMTAVNSRMMLTSSGNFRLYTANGNQTHAMDYSNLGGRFTLYDETGTSATHLEEQINATRLLQLIDGSDMYLGFGSSTVATGNLMFMRPSYTEGMRMDATGNLLIGRTNSTVGQGNKLDVNGAVNASSFLVNGQSVTGVLNSANAIAVAAFAATNAAFGRANTANITADRAWNHANAGFDRANTSLSNTSGTSFVGNAQLPAGNLAIGKGATQGIRLSVNAWIGVANVIPQAEFTGGSQLIQFNANTSGGSWNDLMLNRDASIIFSRGAADDGANLVIGPWTDSSFGYKQDGRGNHGFNTSNPRHTIDANGSANISGSLTVGGSATVGGVDVVPYIRTVDTAGNNFTILADAAIFAATNASFAQANAGLAQANTARNHANAAFAVANTSGDEAASAFLRANLAHTHANAAFAKANAALPATGGTMTGGLTLSSVSPTITWDETDVGGMTWTNLVNANTYYVLVDRDGSGSWELPHPLQLSAAANTGYVFGNKIDAFPSGTAMLFVQTTAPTGWTKSVTHNDKALRIVSGTVGSGGSVAFSSAFTSRTVSGTSDATTATGSLSSTAVTGTVGSTVLTTNQIPSHRHYVVDSSPPNSTLSNTNTLSHKWDSTTNLDYQLKGVSSSVADVGLSSSTGGGLGHDHSFTGGSHTHTFTGTSHTHTYSTSLNMAVQYVDAIIATKD